MMFGETYSEPVFPSLSVLSIETRVVALVPVLKFSLYNQPILNLSNISNIFQPYQRLI